MPGIMEVRLERGPLNGRVGGLANLGKGKMEMVRKRGRRETVRKKRREGREVGERERGREKEREKSDAHAHNTTHLFLQIPHRKHPLRQPLPHPFLPFRILLRHLLRPLNERLHVIHSEELGDERAGGEGLKVVEVFADAEEEDWGVGCGDAVDERKGGPR